MRKFIHTIIFKIKSLNIKIGKAPSETTWY